MGSNSHVALGSSQLQGSWSRKGPLLTNRMTELVTYGSVGGVGRNPGPYPAGDSGFRLCVGPAPDARSAWIFSLRVLTMRRVFYLSGVVGLALVLTAALSLPLYDFHDLGLGANDWNTQSFGWPVAIWSRTVHTYQTVTILSSGERKVQEIHDPNQYSIRWGSASGVFGGALVVSSVCCFAVGARCARETARVTSRGNE